MRLGIFISILCLALTASAQTFLSQEELVGLQVGDTVTPFEGIVLDSTTFHLQEKLDSGEVVIIFIRGQWCPYCNRHMAALQDSLSLIHEKGASLVVVSPDKPEYLAITQEKAHAEFTLIYDSAYQIMKQFDVLFLPSDKILTRYAKFFGNTLKESHSDESQQLPVPATFVLNQEGIITWRHFDINYKKRSTVGEILKALD